MVVRALSLPGPPAMGFGIGTVSILQAREVLKGLFPLGDVACKRTLVLALGLLGSCRAGLVRGFRPTAVAPAVVGLVEGNQALPCLCTG